MTFGEAMKQAIEHGGGYVFGYDNLRYKITDVGTPIPDRENMRHDLSGQNWHVEPIPQPELMTVVKAIFTAINQGGGEIWQTKETESPKYMATLNAEAEVVAGTLGGVSADQELYTVRPIPPVEISDPVVGEYYMYYSVNMDCYYTGPIKVCWKDKDFIVLKKDGCWPIAEKTINCHFRATTGEQH
jgi:hypothetical protein